RSTSQTAFAGIRTRLPSPPRRHHRPFARERTTRQSLVTDNQAGGSSGAPRRSIGDVRRAHSAPSPGGETSSARPSCSARTSRRRPPDRRVPARAARSLHPAGGPLSLWFLSWRVVLMALSWLQRLLKTSRPLSRPAQRHTLTIEALEDRTVPTFLPPVTFPV